jgi:hypothetical protein
VLKEFDETENFVYVAKDAQFMGYQNAWMILILRKGREDI